MPTFAASPDYLARAEQHVIDAEREIVLQRQRIERLRAVGADVADAQALLSTFDTTLLAMQRHLRVEAAAQAMQQRFAVARALARQRLEKQGNAVTDDAVDREAAVLVKGLFVERPQDPIALTARALFESSPRPRPFGANVPTDDATSKT